jgi:hypothetical protein
MPTRSILVQQSGVSGLVIFDSKIIKAKTSPGKIARQDAQNQFCMKTQTLLRLILLELYRCHTNNMISINSFVSIRRML